MSQTTYASVAQFLLAVDSRVVAQLGSDSGADGDLDSTNTIIATAIKRASSDVERAALRGKRYTEAQLIELADDEDWTLIGLVCDRALAHLAGRRLGVMSDEIANRIDASNTLLEQIANGDAIFRDTNSADAGTPETYVISAVNRSTLRLEADSEFFPRSRTSTV